MSAKLSIYTPYYIPIGMREDDYEGIVHANLCVATMMEQGEYDSLCEAHGIDHSYPLSVQMKKMAKEGKITEVKDEIGMSEYFYFTEEQLQKWKVDEVFPHLETGLLMAAKVRYMNKNK